MKKVNYMKDNSLLVVAIKKGEDTHYQLWDDDRNKVFESESFVCSPNLACFLGLAHAASLIQEGDYDNYIYCNNTTALLWFERKTVNATGTDENTNNYLLDSILFLNEIDFHPKAFMFSWKKKFKLNE